MVKNQTRHFRIGGHDVQVSPAVVESKLRGVLAEPVLKHAVKVNGQWYPVKQAIESATGVPRADVISTEARRVFRTLGFDVRP
jgi:hypothetical protein